MSLIATDGLETALREILSTLHRQSADISNIKSELSQCITKTDLTSFEKSIVAKLQAVEQQVQTIERDVAVDTADDSLTEQGDGSSTAAGDRTNARNRSAIGQVVSAHQAHLRSLRDSNAVAATRAMLDEVRSETAAAIRTALEQVADERAARATVEQLSATADALSSQLNAMQGMLHTKVDRSEVVKIQATAAELGTFSTWKGQVSSTVSDMDSRLSSTRVALDKGLESVVKLSGTVQALATTAASKADSKDTVALQHALDRLSADVCTRAPLAELRDTQSTMGTLSGRVSTLEGGVKEVIRQAAEDKRIGESRIAAVTTALRGEITALSESLQREVSRLADEIDARAYVTAVEATDESVQAVRGTVEVLDRKVGVALRFIDWYAEKGELYEANATAVERQLNALALGNRSSPPPTGLGGSRLGGFNSTVGDMRSKVFGTGMSSSAQAAYSPLAKGGAETLIGSTLGGSPGPGQSVDMKQVA